MLRCIPVPPPPWGPELVGGGGGCLSHRPLDLILKPSPPEAGRRSPPRPGDPWARTHSGHDWAWVVGVGTNRTSPPLPL